MNATETKNVAKNIVKGWLECAKACWTEITFEAFWAENKTMIAEIAQDVPFASWDEEAWEAIYTRVLRDDRAPTDRRYTKVNLTRFDMSPDAIRYLASTYRKGEDYGERVTWCHRVVEAMKQLEEDIEEMKVILADSPTDNMRRMGVNYLNHLRGLYHSCALADSSKVRQPAPKPEPKPRKRVDLGLAFALMGRHL